jgi:hypothetical protein
MKSSPFQNTNKTPTLLVSEFKKNLFNKTKLWKDFCSWWLNFTTTKQQELLKEISPYMPVNFDGFFYGETKHSGITPYIIPELNLEDLTNNKGNPLIELITDYCSKEEEMLDKDFNKFMELKAKLGSYFQVEGATEGQFFLNGKKYEINFEKLKSNPQEHQKMMQMIEMGYLHDARVEVAMEQRRTLLFTIFTLLADEFLEIEKKMKSNLILKKSYSKSCHSCNKVEENPGEFKKCGNCLNEFIYYCSKDCQVRNWKKHKVTCQKVSKME